MSDQLLPNIRQAFYPTICKSIKTGFYYEVGENIEAHEQLIGVDDSKYEKTHEEIGSIYFKLKN